MASKNDILYSVNAFTKMAKEVRSASKDAARSVHTILENVESNWWGESGKAMSTALFTLYEKFNKTAAMLDEACSQLSQGAASVCANLPEE